MIWHRPGFKAFLVSLALAVVAGTACKKSPEQTTRGHRVPDAESALDGYLGAASVMSDRTTPDSLSACEVNGPGAYQLALAKHRVLDSETDGDSAIVRAEIVSVGRVDLAPDGPYEVREMIKTDTLSWLMMHVPSSNRWGVCGFSQDGAGFVRLGYLGEATRWLRGTTPARLRRLADSVARTR